MTIAEQMADAYSAKGLETMAGLLEKMGRDQEAESYYQKIQERYEDAGPLDAFYGRLGRTKPAYAAKAQAVERAVFPGGMEAITLAQLSGKPVDGVLVTGENSLSNACGLKSGAIIVGIDGQHVHSMPQYAYVRAMKSTPDLDLLVYQNEHYKAIHAKVPGRHFNLALTTWPQ